MSELSDAFLRALDLLSDRDPVLMEIALLSLRVSMASTLLAAVLGLPLGALLAISRFPGRSACLVLLNALMGIPPVVVGLLVYLALSRAGPLGEHGILFTPGAMVIAQTLLVMPILAALSRQVVEDLHREYDETLRSLGVGRLRAVPTLLRDARYSLLPVVLAGFGRAISEVGAVMIVGGNIAGVTRVMTTAIALETSKGDLAQALGLAIVLLVLSLLVNALAQVVRHLARRRDASEGAPFVVAR